MIKYNMNKKYLQIQIFILTFIYLFANIYLKIQIFIYKSKYQGGSTMYTLYDTITQTTAGSYKTVSTARRAKDRKDAAYGACRYTIRKKED